MKALIFDVDNTLIGRNGDGHVLHISRHDNLVIYHSFRSVNDADKFCR